MADWGGDIRGGSRGRGASGVQTWDGEARRRRAIAAVSRWPDLGRATVERLRDWAIAETNPGRLLPWLPVAFGLGIAIYFAAEREPVWWAAAALAVVCIGATILARRHAIAFPALLAVATVAAGFALATLKTVQVAHPVLARPFGSVAIGGFVRS